MFNSRMQPTQIGLGNGVNSQNLLKLEYEYCATASANNGNVAEEKITFPGVAHDSARTGFVSLGRYHLRQRVVEPGPIGMLTNGLPP